MVNRASKSWFCRQCAEHLSDSHAANHKAMGHDLVDDPWPWDFSDIGSDVGKETSDTTTF